MDVYEQGMFYTNDTDSYYNFFSKEKREFLKKKLNEKRIEEIGVKYGMNQSEAKEFDIKAREIRRLYPSVNDIEVLNQYIKELSDLQKEYRTKSIQTKIPSERKMFSALIEVIVELITVQKNLIVDLSPEPEPAVRPRPISAPLPISELPPVPSPVGFRPPLPLSAPTGMPETEDKKGFDKNKLLIFGGIGVVGILVLYKLFKK
jgi:hypothetical protein